MFKFSKLFVYNHINKNSKIQTFCDKSIQLSKIDINNIQLGLSHFKGLNKSCFIKNLVVIDVAVELNVIDIIQYKNFKKEFYICDRLFNHSFIVNCYKGYIEAASKTSSSKWLDLSFFGFKNKIPVLKVVDGSYLSSIILKYKMDDNESFEKNKFINIVKKDYSDMQKYCAGGADSFNKHIAVFNNLSRDKCIDITDIVNKDLYLLDSICMVVYLNYKEGKITKEAFYKFLDYYNIEKFRDE